MVTDHFSYALRWAVEAGADEAEVRAAWASGRAVDVPIGHLWDVLRVTTTVGVDVIRALDADGVTLGPILEVPPRVTIEFLVPRGHCSQWKRQPSVLLVDSGHIRWPAPDVTLPRDRRAVCGRSWIVPPWAGRPEHTPIGHLFTAVQNSIGGHNAAAEHERRAVKIAAAEARGRVPTLR
ncbi:hypothetical protein [Streptomyces platensis]|uniref:hypothetical protein n=1 Tax=Streptomyces platensis TaxID=58346 RepID=UPI003332A09E